MDRSQNTRMDRFKSPSVPLAALALRVVITSFTPGMESKLSTLRAQNAALKAELQNLQSLAAARSAAAAPAAPAVPTVPSQAADAAPVDAAVNEAQSEERARGLFKYYDTDASNAIDRHEFAALVADLGEIMDDAELNAALATIDTSADGLISFDEFYLWFSNPNRTPATAKGMVQSGLLRLKLAAKMLSIRSADISARLKQQQEEHARASSTVQFEVDVNIGSLSDDAPMGITFHSRAITEEAAVKAGEAFGLPSGSSFITAEIDIDESVPEIEERINMLRGLLSEVGLPDEIQIGLGLDQVAGKSVLRLMATFPAEMFPLPAQLTDDIDRQPGLSGANMEITFPFSFDQFLNDTSLVGADMLGVRVHGKSAYLRGALDFLQQPDMFGLMGSLPSLLAAFILKLRLGSIKDALIEFRDCLPQGESESGESGELTVDDELAEFRNTINMFLMSQPQLMSVLAEQFVPMMMASGPGGLQIFNQVMPLFSGILGLSALRVVHLSGAGAVEIDMRLRNFNVVTLFLTLANRFANTAVELGWGTGEDAEAQQGEGEGEGEGQGEVA